MKTIELTDDLLMPYFTGTKRHAGFADAVKKYVDLRVHANGEFPSELINERRPNESDRVKKYRHSIYEPITADPVNRVITSLSKIHRSSDWIITHHPEQHPPTVADGEKLGDYMNRNFPFTESFEKWLFTVCLKSYLLDANGVILIRPLETEIPTNEFFQPFPFFYHSDQVIEFVPDELLIIAIGEVKSTTKFIVVNNMVIQRWRTAETGFVMESEFVHGLKKLPAIKAGGAFFKRIGEFMLHESRIAPMLPRLNDAAREYSDLQAEVVLHIHSEKWSWASEKCPTCRDGNGIPKGFVNDGSATKKIVCPTCKGNKTVAASPYETTVIRATNSNMGETNVPIPPSGYIQKQIDIVKIQDERISNHLFRALASINFQFLDQTPLNISGASKEIDRDELNNFVFSVADDLVRISKFCARIFAMYRFGSIIPDESKLTALLPDQRTPERFDLLSSNYLADEIKRLKDGNVNPVIVAKLESEYANRKFANNPEIRETIMTILEIDPLVGASDDEKMQRFQSGGVSRVDYIASVNINELVKSAMDADPSFIGKTRADKIAVIRLLAQKKSDEISRSRIVISDTIEP